MKILGISGFYHDSAAALIVDGKVVSAVEEERFSGKKHDSSFPYKSIEWILDSIKTQSGNPMKNSPSKIPITSSTFKLQLTHGSTCVARHTFSLYE